MATFLMTWDGTDSGYHQEMFDQHVEATSEGDEVETTWSTGSRRGGISAGDRVFLLRQTTDRGIVAAGRLTDGAVFAAPHWDDPARDAHYVSVTWERLVPVVDRLRIEELVEEVPGHSWNSVYGFGQELAPDVGADVARRWKRLLARLDRKSGARLPNWTRDETILAYELYLREYANRSGIQTRPIPRL